MDTDLLQYILYRGKVESLEIKYLSIHYSFASYFILQNIYNRYFYNCDFQVDCDIDKSWTASRGQYL